MGRMEKFWLVVRTTTTRQAPELLCPREAQHAGSPKHPCPVLLPWGQLREQEPRAGPANVQLFLCCARKARGRAPTSTAHWRAWESGDIEASSDTVSVPTLSHHHCSYIWFSNYGGDGESLVEEEEGVGREVFLSVLFLLSPFENKNVGDFIPFKSVRKCQDL